jgi:hypothetical protein
MIENDPLWRLRHAITGVALALLLAVLTAALAGAWLGDTGAALLGASASYGTRVTVYGVLLLYVVVGAGVLFAKVARHETQPVSARRVFLWWLSLWVWPGLLLAIRRKP